MLGFWLGIGVALAAVAAAVGSTRLRYQLASAGEQLGNLLSNSLRGLRERMGTPYSRQMAVLQEMGATMDQATSQWEASMTVSKVAAELGRDPQLRGRNIGVRMIGGILHLEGEVRTEEEKKLAGETARRASGAEVLANDLKLSSPVGEEQ